MLLLEMLKLIVSKRLALVCSKTFKKTLQLTKSVKTINNLNQSKPQKEIKMQH